MKKNAVVRICVIKMEELAGSSWTSIYPMMWVRGNTVGEEAGSVGNSVENQGTDREKEARGIKRRAEG